MRIAITIVIAAALCAQSSAAEPLYGARDFYPSDERPIGWRGDGTGAYPGARPVAAFGDGTVEMQTMPCTRIDNAP